MQTDLIFLCFHGDFLLERIIQRWAEYMHTYSHVRRCETKFVDEAAMLAINLHVERSFSERVHPVIGMPSISRGSQLTVGFSPASATLPFDKG